MLDVPAHLSGRAEHPPHTDVFLSRTMPVCRWNWSGPPVIVRRTMAVDQFELLQWLAERHDANPGALPTGSDVRWQARHLDRDQQDPAAVSQALSRLRAQGWISWVFTSWPNQSTEPPPHMFTDMNTQQVRDVAVTTDGYRVLADRRSPAPTQQVNIVGSSVGQLALGNIDNITLTTILDGAERELAAIDAPEEAKTEVRGVLEKMRALGGSLSTGVAVELLTAAVRRALGLG